MNDDLRRVTESIRLSRRTSAILWQYISLTLGDQGGLLRSGPFGGAILWMAVFADMGASLLVVANGLRLLKPPVGYRQLLVTVLNANEKKADPPRRTDQHTDTRIVAAEPPHRLAPAGPRAGIARERPLRVRRLRQLGTRTAGEEVSLRASAARKALVATRTCSRAGGNLPALQPAGARPCARSRPARTPLGSTRLDAARWLAPRRPTRSGGSVVETRPRTTGHLTDCLPVGNTGGSNLSAFACVPVSPDLPKLPREVKK